MAISNVFKILLFTLVCVLNIADVFAMECKESKAAEGSARGMGLGDDIESVTDGVGALTLAPTAKKTDGINPSKGLFQEHIWKVVQEFDQAADALVEQYDQTTARKKIIALQRGYSYLTHLRAFHAKYNVHADAAYKNPGMDIAKMFKNFGREYRVEWSDCNIPSLSTVREMLVVWNCLCPITELELQNNRIKRIEGLNELVDLGYLDLRNNRIKRIEGLGALVNLYSLLLSSNQIKYIEGLDTLIELCMLHLDYNQIVRIEGLDTLVKINNLRLSYNRIKRIEGLDRCNLNTLFLSGNRIERIEGLDTQVCLSHLYLSYNRIKRLEGLNKLINHHRLWHLWLSNNQIEYIDASFSIMYDLDLRDNRLTEQQKAEILRQIAWADV